VDPLAMIVDSYREFLLGGFLSNNILIQELFDFEWLGQLMRARSGSFRTVILKNGIADSNAFVAYICSWIVAR